MNAIRRRLSLGFCPPSKAVVFGIEVDKRVCKGLRRTRSLRMSRDPWGFFLCFSEFRGPNFFHGRYEGVDGASVRVFVCLQQDFSMTFI